MFILKKHSLIWWIVKVSFLCLLSCSGNLRLLRNSPAIFCAVTCRFIICYPGAIGLCFESVTQRHWIFGIDDMLTTYLEMCIYIYKRWPPVTTFRVGQVFVQINILVYHEISHDVKIAKHYQYSLLVPGRIMVG